MMKECSKCLIEKDYSDFRKSDGYYRTKCKECERQERLKRYRESSIETKAKIMASSILKRLKYCKDEKNIHLKCYRDNNIQCLLGNTVDEITEYILKEFRTDIENLLAQGLTPSVDRINPLDHYREGNIRIIDKNINSKMGFQNANEARKTPVKAVYPNGDEVYFESIREASRKLNLDKHCISRLAKENGTSRKEKIKFYFV